METVEVWLCVLLDSGLDLITWSDSRSSRFILAGKVRGTRCERSWAGPTSELDSVEKTKISVPTGNQTGDFLILHTIS
jgi:hypothetical protein